MLVYQCVLDNSNMWRKKKWHYRNMISIHARHAYDSAHRVLKGFSSGSSLQEHPIDQPQESKKSVPLIQIHRDILGKWQYQARIDVPHVVKNSGGTIWVATYHRNHYFNWPPKFIRVESGVDIKWYMEVIHEMKISMRTYRKSPIKFAQSGEKWQERTSRSKAFEISELGNLGEVGSRFCR